MTSRRLAARSLDPRAGRSAATLLLGLLVGVAGGCLIDLPHHIACGDGHTDLLAGEECDPGDPLSFEGACLEREGLGGHAVCDKDSCKIITSQEICAFCGDGIVSPGEDCDGNNLGNKKCRSGHDQVTCNPLTCAFDDSECPKCGNGVPDFGEECDWNYDPPGEFAEVRQCSGLDPLGEIDYKPYTSGQVLITACSESCILSRKPCGFCGDGFLDKQYIDGPPDAPVNQGAEVCDSEIVDVEALSMFCRTLCRSNSEDDVTNYRCDYVCAKGCKELDPPPIVEDPIDEAKCCVRGGSSCDPQVPCCWAMDHPGEVGCKSEAIETPEGTKLVDRCRMF
ncbi:MAG: hypothetical protein R3B09_03950 [Nannocystaceae bacterium]